MTRSVEIPDAAVEAAHAKYYEGSYQFLQSASRTAMRAALVAARPYLMPTHAQLDQWLSDHEKVWHGELGDRCACGWQPDSWESEDEFDEYYREHRTDAVLALLNGES